MPRWIAGASPRRTALRAAALVAAAYLTFSYVLLPVRGAGISMSPTIEPDDLLFVNLMAYRFRAPRRGDIVAVRIGNRTAVYVKRLVALPGDRVAIDEGVLSVNDEPAEEPYVVHRAPWRLDAVTLGPDDYFVVGDNRGMPMAQHEMGTATLERLIGPKIF